MNGKLQLSLNKIQKWATENGFKFSKAKTNCMHFCKRRGLHADPELKLGTTPITSSSGIQMLGLIFYNKLTFAPHLKYLKAKCQKALNLMRVVANNDWGADLKVLHRLYISHVGLKNLITDVLCMVQPVKPHCGRLIQYTTRAYDFAGCIPYIKCTKLVC